MNILIYIVFVPRITFTISSIANSVLIYRKLVSCFSLKTAIFLLAFPVSQMTREEVAAKKETVTGNQRARPHAHCWSCCVPLDSLAPGQSYLEGVWCQIPSFEFVPLISSSSCLGQGERKETALHTIAISEPRGDAEIAKEGTGLLTCRFLSLVP